jgi:hypothetical protein
MGVGLTPEKMEESFVVLTVKKNIPLLYPPIVKVVETIFNVSFNRVFCWHFG